MKNDVKIMTEVFKNAMIFEKYKQLWSDALKYVDDLLLINKNKTDNALAGIENEEFTIVTIDKTYEIYIDNAKKDIRKYKTILFALIGTISVFLIILATLWALNIRKAFSAILFVLSPIVMGLGPIIVLCVIGYCIHNITKRKKDIKRFSAQASSQQIIIAENNIKSYNLFLEKAKSEESYLLSKKQSILSEYNKAKDVLNQIYSKGLIPQRYQGLVQTATIYGYLYNGICTNICGHGGVYERYEDDLQRGIIIGCLNSISEKLDIVIKNQIELKKTLDSIDMTLSGIKKEVEYSNQILSDIRTNTAIGAAAAQQSAAYQEYIATAVWRSL